MSTVELCDLLAAFWYEIAVAAECRDRRTAVFLAMPWFPRRRYRG